MPLRISKISIMIFFDILKNLISTLKDFFDIQNLSLRTSLDAAKDFIDFLNDIL